MSEYNTEKRINIDGISTVQIVNPIGRIEVAGWDEKDIQITTTIKSDHEIAGDIQTPVIEQKDDTLVIRVIQNEKLSTTKTNIGELDLDFSLGDSDKINQGLQDFIGKIVNAATSSVSKISKGLHASIFIKLPKSLNLIIKNLNGMISISDVSGQIRAKGVNGPISLTNISGNLMASTVNGPVSLDKSDCQEITLKSVNGPVKCYLNAVNGDVALKCVNGPIRVSIPDNAHVNLAAKTMHGAIKISSDFNQKIRSNRKVSSILNNGSNNMSIKTSTGAITVVTSNVTDTAASSRPANRPPRPAAPVDPALPVQPAKPIPPVAPIQPIKQSPQPPVTNLPDEQNMDSSDKPKDIIERMLESGKISAQEAEQLRQAL